MCVHERSAKGEVAIRLLHQQEESMRFWTVLGFLGCAACGGWPDLTGEWEGSCDFAVDPALAEKATTTEWLFTLTFDETSLEEQFGGEATVQHEDGQLGPFEVTGTWLGGGREPLVKLTFPVEGVPGATGLSIEGEYTEVYDPETRITGDCAEVQEDGRLEGGFAFLERP
jgi:hypothetical protein